jgi:hypothetical protein
LPKHQLQAPRHCLGACFFINVDIEKVFSINFTYLLFLLMDKRGKEAYNKNRKKDVMSCDRGRNTHGTKRTAETDPQSG